jgi:MFS transporter, PAT family, beta-lactamase induction signal transducer AmpG
MNERFRRLTLFGAIYFIEGTVLTYFSSFNVLYLRSFDLSYTRIGLISGITLLPFVLKIVIGLLSDRFPLFRMGYRRPYILIGLLMQTLGLAMLAFVSPLEQFPLFLTACILASLGMSTYDTTTDGLSIDSTPEAERGQVQGIMVGMRAFSAVVIALWFGFLSNRGLWSTAFISVAILTALVIPLALSVHEPAERSEEKKFDRGAFHSFLNWGLVLFAILGMVYPLALYSANGMISAFLNEVLKINMQTVGLYMSVYGIGTVAGALVGGPLVKRFGRRTSLMIALFLTSAVTLTLALVPSAGLAWGVVSLFGIAFGYYETVYFAMGMDFADPRIAAFMFSVIMAVGNLGIGLGQPLAGSLVDSIGFRWMFAVFAGVNLLALPLVIGVFKLRKDLR